MSLCSGAPLPIGKYPVNCVLSVVRYFYEKEKVDLFNICVVLKYLLYNSLEIYLKATPEKN